MTGAAPRRIGIVVTDAYADEDPDHDTPLLLEALRARGVAAESVVWHDAGVDLGAFELLVIRSPWDYPERPAEFAAWLDRAAAATRVVNPPHTVRWNLDKRYLAELAHAGIRVVPTTYAETVDAAASAMRVSRSMRGRQPASMRSKPPVGGVSCAGRSSSRAVSVSSRKRAMSSAVGGCSSASAAKMAAHQGHFRVNGSRSQATLWRRRTCYRRKNLPGDSISGPTLPATGAFLFSPALSLRE